MKIKDVNMGIYRYIYEYDHDGWRNLHEAYYKDDNYFHRFEFIFI